MSEDGRRWWTHPNGLGKAEVRPCADCGGSGWESPPITNAASPEPGEPCRTCQFGGVDG